MYAYCIIFVTLSAKSRKTPRSETSRFLRVNDWDYDYDYQ